MKFKRVNMPNSEEGKEEINDYLIKIYVDKENFLKIQKTYLGERENQKNPKYLNDSKIREIVDKNYETTTWHLFLNFVIGVKETAFYLAMCYIEGYGTIKNEFLTFLTMAIGVKLGDKRSIELVANDPLPDNAQKLADRCITEIKIHQEEVKNREVSWEEIMARGKKFDYLVQQSGHSYLKTIKEDREVGMKSWAKYVEPIMEEYTPVLGGKSHCEIS